MAAWITFPFGFIHSSTTHALVVAPVQLAGVFFFGGGEETEVAGMTVGADLTRWLRCWDSRLRMFEVALVYLVGSARLYPCSHSEDGYRAQLVSPASTNLRLGWPTSIGNVESGLAAVGKPNQPCLGSYALSFWTAS